MTDYYKQILTDEQIIECARIDQEDSTKEGWISRQRIRMGRAIEHAVIERLAKEPALVIAWIWEEHGWTVTAHGKYQSINRYVDLCQPPLSTQESPNFIRLIPLCINHDISQ